METLARWVINLFCGSILTFYGSALILLLFRPFIRSARALYFFYLLPFFKVTSDFLFSSHEQWVYLSKESILLQPENSRTLSALAAYEGTYPFLSLKLHLQNGHLFSIGDIIAECFPPIILFIIFSFIILGTAISLFRLGYQIYRNLQWDYEPIQY